MSLFDMFDILDMFDMFVSDSWPDMTFIRHKAGPGLAFGSTKRVRSHQQQVGQWDGTNPVRTFAEALPNLLNFVGLHNFGNQTPCIAMHPLFDARLRLSLVLIASKGDHGPQVLRQTSVKLIYGRNR